MNATMKFPITLRTEELKEKYMMIKELYGIKNVISKVLNEKYDELKKIDREEFKKYSKGNLKERKVLSLDIEDCRKIRELAREKKIPYYYVILYILDNLDNYF